MIEGVSIMIYRRVHNLKTVGEIFLKMLYFGGKRVRPSGLQRLLPTISPVHKTVQFWTLLFFVLIYFYISFVLCLFLAADFAQCHAHHLLVFLTFWWTRFSLWICLYMLQMLSVWFVSILFGKYLTVNKLFWFIGYLVRTLYYIFYRCGGFDC